MNPLSLVPGVDDAFWPLFLADCRTWSVWPVDVAKILYCESNFGLNPVHFDAYGQPEAVGLNQLYRSNWKNYLGSDAPEVALAYARLPASAQWQKVVRRYFAGQIAAHPEAKSARDLYWLNFVPAFYKAGAPDDYVMTTDIGYGKNNPGLVLDADKQYDASGKFLGGVLRPGGITAFLNQTVGGARWNQILVALGTSPTKLAARALVSKAATPAGVLLTVAAVTTASAAAIAYLEAGK